MVQKLIKINRKTGGNLKSGGNRDSKIVQLRHDDTGKNKKTDHQGRKMGSDSN